MTVLDELAAAAATRVKEAEKTLSREKIQEAALALAEQSPKTGSFPFEQALKKPGLSFLCECKKASPSRGLISPDFPYLSIAKEYEEAGADALSVLTEPTRFLGSDAYLSEIAAASSLPCLRKDFTVDDYMIDQALLLGASAILLIVSLLTREELTRFLALSERLGLSALVEVHDREEVDAALSCGAKIVGVNNRNLKDFSVDTDNTRRLRDAVPPSVLFVSESGIKTPADVRALRELEVDAVLVGETLMRAPDKKKKLAELRGEG